ncbi:unnamed protein product [Effrenium voratum]|nr:unnamed protein product [Effrenium voratum]
MDLPRLLTCDEALHLASLSKSDLRHSASEAERAPRRVEARDGRETWEALAARLCAPLASEPMRAFHERQQIHRRQLEEMSECTFTPDLSTSTASRQLQLRSSPASCQSEDRPPMPKTMNPIPEHFSSARAYVSQNVFRRLSRPRRVPEVPTAAPEKCGDLRGFLERQNAWEERRQQRLKAPRAPPGPSGASGPSRRAKSPSIPSRGSGGFGGSGSGYPHVSLKGPSEDTQSRLSPLHEREELISEILQREAWTRSI